MRWFVFILQDTLPLSSPSNCPACLVSHFLQQINRIIIINAQILTLLTWNIKTEKYNAVHYLVRRTAEQDYKSVRGIFSRDARGDISQYRERERGIIRKIIRSELGINNN